MNNYKIAIPSLKRANVLNARTYKFLKKHEIADSNIYIFVIDNEYEIYKEVFPECNIVVGRFTAKNNKNYILDYFPENEIILQLDDDIKDLFRAPDINTLESLSNLDEFVQHSVEKLEEHKTNLLGVYPIKNAGFMWRNKEHLSTNLNYCCGAVLLYKNHRLKRRSLNLIEDFEFSLINFLTFGKILRNNLVCVEANQYTLDGGLQHNNKRTKENKLNEIKKLQAKYPVYVKISMKKNSQPDIRFAQRGKTPPVSTPQGGVNKSTFLTNKKLESIPEQEKEEPEDALNIKKHCEYIFKKGLNNGKQCTVKTTDVYCKKHKKLIDGKK